VTDPSPRNTTTHAATFAAAFSAACVCACLIAGAAGAANGPSHALISTLGSAASTPANPYPLVEPTDVAVDHSNGDIYVTNSSRNERQTLTLDATGGNFSINFEGQTTPGIPYNTSAAELTAALEALPKIGSHDVEVSGGPYWTATADITSGSQQITGLETFATLPGGYLELGQQLLGPPGIAPGTTLTGTDLNDHELTMSQPATETATGVGIEGRFPYAITFLGARGEEDVPQLSASSAGLTGGASTATIATNVDGGKGNDVEKFAPSGQFILLFGKKVNKTAIAASRPEREQNVCPAPGHPSDECQAGQPAEQTPCKSYDEPEHPPCPPVTGVSAAEFSRPAFLAVDNSRGSSDGDVYVGDSGTQLVQKFDSSGQIIASWGEEGKGQKDGRDAGDLPIFGPIVGLAVDSTGILDVYGRHWANDGWRFTSTGSYIEWNALSGSDRLLELDPPFSYTVAERRTNSGTTASSFIHVLEPVNGNGNVELGERENLTEPVAGSIVGFTFDPLTKELYAATDDAVYHYSKACELATDPCGFVDSFGEGALSNARGIDVDGDRHVVYVADSGHRDIAVFGDVRPRAETGPQGDAGETTLTLTGTVDPEANGQSHGEITACSFEYGFTKAYGHLAPCEPDPSASPFAHSEAVTAHLTGLTPTSQLPIGTEYHYRVVATNSTGATAEGADRIAVTTAVPRIEGVSSSHITATSAELDARLKPNGLPTTYHFEYGINTAYGNDTSPEELTGSTVELSAVHSVAAAIEGLQPGVTYHFRLLVENALDQGTPVVSEDQTFEFFPPSCPNSAVRQQTGSAYLPDCRAYELVSPSNANATLLYSGGPNTGRAVAPARFSFTGGFSSLPGANTIETGGDLYVATRTDTGWVSRYIGLPGDTAGCMGGPPTAASSNFVAANPPWLTNTVLADPSMSHILNFNDGSPIGCFETNGFNEGSWKLARPSNAPYLWNADGTLQQRLPTSLTTVPGGADALRCSYQNFLSSVPNCTGETTASSDLNHLVFSSNQMAFAEDEATDPPAPGLTEAPGSAYDNDVAQGTAKLISVLPDGSSIPQDSVFATVPSEEVPEAIMQGGAEEFIRFPGVSADGSHILMSTATGYTTCVHGTQAPQIACPRPSELPLHLYMRVDDAVTYEIANAKIIHYLGMTEDGSKVYFTSAEALTTEDKDSSTDLYMWSEHGAEEGHPLTLLSGGDNEGETGEAGNSDGCSVSWTVACGVLPLNFYEYSALQGGRGGNGVSDTALASRSGDIYFYSPEQLDGNDGVLGQQNLYDYREGRPQFVASFVPGKFCTGGFIQACNGPVIRMNVSPDGAHASFLTADRLTSYDNAGHPEIYSFTPASGNLVCDSCNPSGQPATADVEASQDGLFMADDGRTFFSTSESLIPRDTNEGVDVYEFVDGRPQLITPGTGTADRGSPGEFPGLVAVSANGTDIYFGTFDSLISEDHNGNFLKYYDARTNGGFPQLPPAQPCAAAEECHGPGTEAPGLPTQGTAAAISGGNLPTSRRANHKSRRKSSHSRRAKHHRPKARHHQRQGGDR
jgi:hypothetical protein